MAGYELSTLRAHSLRSSPYAALDSGRVDAAVAFTTDPLPGKSSRHRLLRDPKRLFGPQNVAPVVATNLVTTLGPRFTATVNAVSAKLTQSAMKTMTAAVLVDKQSPEKVAQAFLVAAGVVSAANVFVASAGSDAGARCKRFRMPIPNPDPSGTSLCRTFGRAYQLGPSRRYRGGANG